MEHAANNLDMTRWLIIGTAGSTRFFGRLDMPEATSDVTSYLLAALSNNWPVTLFPVFEFLAPIQPREEGFMRKPLILPVDFVLHGTPVYVRPVFAYLCKDMRENDRDAYKSFVEQALELTQHLMQERDGGGESGGTKH